MQLLTTIWNLQLEGQEHNHDRSAQLALSLARVSPSRIDRIVLSIPSFSDVSFVFLGSHSFGATKLRQEAKILSCTCYIPFDTLFPTPNLQPDGNPRCVLEVVTSPNPPWALSSMTLGDGVLCCHIVPSTTSSHHKSSLAFQNNAVLDSPHSNTLLQAPPPDPAYATPSPHRKASSTFYRLRVPELC